jgi:hypothetical protein
VTTAAKRPLLNPGAAPDHSAATERSTESADEIGCAARRRCHYRWRPSMMNGGGGRYGSLACFPLVFDWVRQKKWVGDKEFSKLHTVHFQVNIVVLCQKATQHANKVDITWLKSCDWTQVRPPSWEPWPCDWIQSPLPTLIKSSGAKTVGLVSLYANPTPNP